MVEREARIPKFYFVVLELAFRICALLCCVWGFWPHFSECSSPCSKMNMRISQTKTNWITHSPILRALFRTSACSDENMLNNSFFVVLFSGKTQKRSSFVTALCYLWLGEWMGWTIWVMTFRWLLNMAWSMLNQSLLFRCTSELFGQPTSKRLWGWRYVTF